MDITNKGQFLDAVAAKANVTNRQATVVFEAIQDVITESLKAGEKVTITGFGSFEAKSRDARTCRNPQTGETVQVPAKVVPKFSAGSILKEALK